MNKVTDVTILPGAGNRYDKIGQLKLRTKAFTDRTVTDCLLQAKKELGPEAVIVSRRTYKKGAIFGRWGGRDMVEMTFGTYQPSATAPQSPAITDQSPAIAPSPLRYSGGEKLSQAEATRIQQLEAKLATLTETIQGRNAEPLKQPEPPKPAGALAAFVPAALQADPQGGSAAGATRLVASEPVQKSRRRRGPALAPPVAAAVPEEGYSGLIQQLLEADIAAPLARQFVSEVPAGLTASDAATYLRTVLSQRLKIANGIDALPVQGKMRLLAFVGTTGVGKTTTIVKLTARYALVERRKVGVITLDTQRIGAAEQLQKYGEILKVPVKIAHDKLELIQQLEAFAAEGKEIILLDTAGRSPNEMIPLGETAHLFEGVGSVQKYLTVPAVLSQRDMENTVTKFQHIFQPDAVILTKLDEASDHTCFGRLLTLQAKFGLPLAFVTTGQRIPDDIVLPDAHAIASRILSTPLL